MSDFFENHYGLAENEMGHPRRATIRDWIYDLRLLLVGQRTAVDRYAQSMPPQRVLIVGVEVPSRGNALREITARLAQSRHDIVTSTVVMQPKGKFENIQDAIEQSGEPLSSFDWLLITDDDVRLPARFTDRFIAAAALTGLIVSQPAHRFLSYTSYDLTRRRLGSLVRQSRFVEIGPITLIHSTAFGQLVPFPPSRWAWGLDVVWAEICRRGGWRMGIVDAVAINHTRPVAESYGTSEAADEGRRLLGTFDVSSSRAELLTPGAVLLPVPAGGRALAA